MVHTLGSDVTLEYGGFWVRLAPPSKRPRLRPKIPMSPLGLAIGVGYYISFSSHGGTLGRPAVGLRIQKGKTGEEIGYGASLVLLYRFVRETSLRR